MKKLAVLLLIFALSVTPSAAQTLTFLEKPEMPADYENWPHKYQGACRIDEFTNLPISIFTRISKENAVKIELVVTANDNREIAFTALMTGTANEADPMSGKVYIQTSDKKWVDVSDLEPYTKQNRKRTKEEIRELVEFTSKNQKTLQAFDMFVNGCLEQNDNEGLENFEKSLKDAIKKIDTQK